MKSLNTPAFRAGIKSGDKILKIDKTSTSGMSVDEAIKLNQSYIEAWTRKSRSLAVQGKSDEAIQCLDEAIKLNPQSDKLLVLCNKSFKF